MLSTPPTTFRSRLLWKIPHCPQHPPQLSGKGCCGGFQIALNTPNNHQARVVVADSRGFQVALNTPTTFSSGLLWRIPDCPQHLPQPSGKGRSCRFQGIPGFLNTLHNLQARVVVEDSTLSSTPSTAFRQGLFWRIPDCPQHPPPPNL